MYTENFAHLREGRVQTYIEMDAPNAPNPTIPKAQDQNVNVV